MRHRIVHFMCLAAACAAPEEAAGPPGSMAGPETPPAPAIQAWHWERPLPTGNRVVRLWHRGPRDVWGVGEVGTLVHYDGERWTHVDSGTTNDLRDVWGDGLGSVWAVGDAGTVVHHDGARAVLLNPPTNRNLVMISGSSADDLWVMGDSFVINGPPGNNGYPNPVQQWQLLHGQRGAWTQDLFILGSRDYPLWISSLLHLNGQLWSVGSHVLAFDGSSWRIKAGTNGYRDYETSYGPFWASPSEMWVAKNYSLAGTPVSKGGLLRCVGGADCTTVDESRDTRYTVLGARGPDEVWARADHFLEWPSRIEYLRWNGAKLERLPGTTTPPTDLNRPAYQADAPLGGNGAGMDPNAFVYAMAGGGPDDLWAAGKRMFQRKEGRWTEVPMPGAVVYGMWGSTATGLWAVGERGAAYLNHGTGWRTVPTGVEERLRAMTGSAPDDLWVLGDRSVLHWDGASFQALARPAEVGSEVRVAAGGRGELWIADPALGLFWLRGEAWTRSALPDGELPGNLWKAGAELWALGQKGHIFRFQEGAWIQRLHVPMAPERLGLAYGRDAGDIWVTDKESGAQALHWDGTRWGTVRLGCKTRIDGFLAAGGDLWAFGQNASILRYGAP